MLRKLAFLAVIVALAHPAAARAQQLTKKLDYAPVNGVQDVRVELQQVVVNQIVFKPGRSLGGPVRRSDASAEVRMDNNGPRDQIVGVALVLVDGDGNVVAAGSGGTHFGHLKAGERDLATINFPYVYRYFDRAKTIWLTLELAPAEPDVRSPAPIVTPGNPGAPIVTPGNPPAPVVTPGRR